MECFDYNILPQWIKNSNFIKQQEQSEEIYLLAKYLIPDILTNEKFNIVSKSIDYFDGKPDNFWDYIRNVDLNEINEVLESKIDKQREFILFLIEFKKTNINVICHFAAEKGNLELLKYAINNNFYYDKLTFEYAIRSGNLDCILFLDNIRCDWDKLICFNICIQYNHLHLFDFIHNKEIYKLECFLPCHQSIFYDRLEFFKLFLNNGYYFDKELCYYRIFKYALFDFVDYFLNKGYTFENISLNNAVSSDNLDFIIFLHKKGFKFTVYNVAMAANYGNLQMLQFFHESGYEWNEETCKSAIFGNHLNCLKYAIKNRCPHSLTDCITIATIHNSIKCKEYLCSVC